VIAVHLYGQPADVEPIAAAVDRDRVAIIEDCAQAHGASSGAGPVGLAGDLAAWSFYPTKNLGCLGDGGAVTTAREDLADRVRSLRMYGESERYLSTEVGVNSRLDELQAAVLRLKLPHLAEWVSQRRSVAAVYDKALAAGAATPPPAPDPDSHARHLYPVQVADRDRVRDALADAGVNTGVHYPRGAHDQPCFADWRQDDLPVTERLCASVLSLPIHPFVTEAQAEEIAARLLDAVDDPAR
jgi:dTDP-4-amino-4,6-dideoxygalactose transaminase